MVPEVLIVLLPLVYLLYPYDRSSGHQVFNFLNFPYPAVGGFAMGIPRGAVGCSEGWCLRGASYAQSLWVVIIIPERKRILKLPIANLHT